MLPAILTDGLGMPLKLLLQDGTQLGNISTELCLRLACVHTGRLPAFLFSQVLQYEQTRGPNIYASPIIFPSVFLPNDLTIHIPVLAEYLHPDEGTQEYLIVPENELNELLRERIIVIDEDDCLSYITLSPSWHCMIRQRCGNAALLDAAWRVTALLGRKLPDPYSHPLQVNLAANCKEVLDTTILPILSASGPPKDMFDESSDASLCCLARLSFYSLLCNILPLEIHFDSPSHPFTGFCQFIKQISSLLECGTDLSKNNQNIPRELIQLMTQMNPKLEEIAVFCLSAAWPNFDSTSHALLQEQVHMWTPKSSSWHISETLRVMIDEALWDDPSIIGKGYSAGFAASVASLLKALDKPVGAAWLLETALEGSVELFSTPLAAELVKCLHAIGDDAKAIEIGEKTLEKLVEVPGVLPAEPFVRIALADVHMGIGNYTRAMELLKPILCIRKVSVRLKMLASLRLNKAKRRTEDELDMSILGPKSSLKYVFQHLDTASRPLKLVCLSELLATLNELCTYNAPQVRAATLPNLAWRRLSDDRDRSLRSDWRLEILGSILQVQDRNDSNIELSIGHPCFPAIVARFYKRIETDKLGGLRGKNLNTKTEFLPRIRITEYFNHEDFLNGILELVSLEHGNPIRIVIKERYAMATCILLLLRRWDLLLLFTSREDLQDRHLPLLTRPTYTPFDDLEFWKQFYEIQWRFCVRPLARGEETMMPPEYIVPIHHDRYLGADTCAVIEKATVHRDYIERGSLVCVLKTFTSSHAKDSYAAELRLFRRILRRKKYPEYIIGFLGSVQSGNTFALLLEYVNKGDLESYMRQVSSPTSEIGIESLWLGILQLGRASEYLRTICHDEQDTEISILVSQQSDRLLFKFANFGVIDFNTRNSKVEDILNWNKPSSLIYRPPEIFSAGTLAINAKDMLNQSADVWSLGCVYSEIAIWSAFGYPKLEHYRCAREREDIPEFVCRGSFHDGYESLLSVAAFHAEASEDSTFNAPKLVIPLIRNMLLPRASRPSLRRVVAESSEIERQLLKVTNRRRTPQRLPT
ncbi:hypothetical protein F4804DRAFT_336344 [Jackrogersella minutella]|nr:hypothetical protein F4804DRAFT_336344 [Jackrogersella minutella]